MIQDFKFALRHLLKAPGFTATAVLTLALAIGVNSAIFALINSVVLHPVVPLRPNEVVNVFTARQNASHDYRQFSYPEYRELRDNGGDVFTDLAALEFAVAGIGRDHEMRRSFAFLTSENYFSLMGTKPYRGRFYSAEECKPSANIAVVVASYGFWKRMGGRNDFVGSTLQINGQPYTVIGIAPDGFSGASVLIAPDIWVPLGIRSQLGSAFGDSETMHDLMNPKNYAFNLTGRMRSGMNFDQDLIVRRGGFRDVRKLQVGYAVVAVDDGFHLVARRSRKAITVVGRPPVGDKHKHDCEYEQDKNDAENPL